MSGEFDILVNDIWGGDDLVEWGKKLWETKLEDGLLLIDRAIKTHIITSYYGLPRIRPGGSGGRDHGWRRVLLPRAFLL